MGQLNNMHLRNLNRVRYLHILFLERSDIFSHKKWKPRREFRPLTRRIIDKKLYIDKQKAIAPDQNLYKAEGVKYTREEIANSRLLTKSLDGLIFVAREFSKMYPDATFFGMVRNGFAVCEGHIRRGWKTEEIAKCYEAGCQQIIKDSQTIRNYHILKFEDIVNDPSGSLRRIYDLAGLDLSEVEKIRLSDKPVIDKAGKHQKVVDEDATNGKARSTRYNKIYWYSIDEFGNHFRKDVNDNQIRLLSQEQKETILRYCRNSLEHFGYI